VVTTHAPQQNLHVRLLKRSVSRFDSALEETRRLDDYAVKRGLRFQGRLYIAPPSTSPPRWLEFVQTGVTEGLRGLTNRTNAAVLLLRRTGRVFAFTFGHGRHLLRDELAEPDFGIRTALNALQHDSLRSLDTFTIEDQTLHTRSQASRASGIEAFGLDIGRDILRGVTGNPRRDVPFLSVSGSEATLAMRVATDFQGLSEVCDTLLTLYRKRTYKDHFSWVDNVARVTDPTLIAQLDQTLLASLTGPKAARPYLAPPEPIEWQQIAGFAYSRQPSLRDADLDIDRYLRRSPRLPFSVDHLKRDKVLAYGAANGASPAHRWPVYRCLVLEVPRGNARYVFTTGAWFEIDKDFASAIRRSLRSIPVSPLQLDPVRTLRRARLEAEGDYNIRVANANASIALMDKKTANCRTASTPIEFCDLFTTDRHLIHVKHRKGGSSSLSHLFAQARISAEAFAADDGFRAAIGDHLAKHGPPFSTLVSPAKPNPSQYTIVFAILGADTHQPGQDLPFFSQLNLVRTQESLVSMGFNVELLGIPTSHSQQPVAG
jgi:uncharacterized protein (TIGR04141 family)